MGMEIGKDQLEQVMTEQARLIFGKFFRSIPKIFNGDNTYSGFKYL